MSVTTPRFPTLVHTVAGIPVGEIAERFGTPVFVYEAATIVERINDLKQFDVVRYAQKALSNLAVLDLVRRSGAVVDAVSAGEVHRAMAAGFRPTQDNHPQIVYTADIFDRDALELVVEQGIPVNCGSPDMIAQYGEACAAAGKPGLGVTLRINPGFGHGHSQKTNTGGAQSKHGIWHEQVGLCKELASKHGLTLTGVHMHIGSGTDMEHLSQVCGAMEKIALEVGNSVRSISAGGGISTPYREEDEPANLDGYFELWDGTRQKLAQAFGHPVSLEIEPGRYLSAECGSLVAEVRAVKQMGENLFYLVDAGFNNLARPILYGAYHPMAIAPADGATDRPEQEVVVGGPLCESGDIFTQEDGGFVSSRGLPEAKVGDYLVIGCAGAYSAVMGSNYNSKPLAAEVLVEGGEAHLVRARQTVDDLVQGEVIPTR